ncbi:hypothetical protein OVN20_06170 [Microcella daejeonensis]|uniref:hypothetical protein n=1 Tax=Microcella daejeonensis TaxID=2994971 RepID=UPI00226F2FDF|nr:hypothetical protein [Microcella daejeonensis]WAB85131.1 hypothetical protein OVN20_06170 [Microcella daejeonensis]
MTEPLDAIALAAEVIAWLTLPIGVVLLAIGFGRRAWANRYRSAKAVITNVDDRDAKLRWFGEEGEVHETVSPLTGPIPAVGDARTVWIHPARPGSARLDTPVHDGRALLLLGWILTGVGVIGILVSNLMPFFQ